MRLLVVLAAIAISGCADFPVSRTCRVNHDKVDYDRLCEVLGYPRNTREHTACTLGGLSAVVISANTDEGFPAKQARSTTVDSSQDYEVDAYGLGVHADAYGRPFRWKTQDGKTDPLLEVTPDAYGPGVGMDQYGRPVTAQPAW